MLKIIVKIFLIFIFSTSLTFAENNTVIRSIDINQILNQSIVGKEIINDLDSHGKKILEEHKDIENNLLISKEKILSQKNLLSKNEFEKKILNHQKKVSEYQNKKQNDLNIMNQKKLDLTNKLLSKLNDILIEYKKKNSIDMIVKKESVLIISNELDITKIILDEFNKRIKKL